MPLKLRPTGLGSGFDKDRLDYTVFCGGWEVGRSRISRPAAVPDRLRWFWTLHPASQRHATSNQVATLVTAKAEFEASWKQWKAWAGLEEVT